jgi:hypothetical protein
MIHELRIYDCAPGRRPDLIRRFNDHTLALFDKHGFRWSEFLSDRDNPDRLVYFLIWEDMAERDRKFPAFLADPAWIKARGQSERDGPVTTSVTSTYYDPLTFPSKR